MRKWVLLGLTLSAIASAGILPLFLNNANKCGGSNPTAAARQTIASMNRAQQAYALEKNKFSSTVEPLGLGIKLQTPNYTFSTRATPKAAFNSAIARRDIGIHSENFGPFTWEAKDSALKTYIGAVFFVPIKVIDPTDQSGETTTITILCEATKFGITHSAEPTYKNGVMTCGAGTEKFP